jgi:tetratricopeptide (TPR) repeat protein
MIRIAIAAALSMLVLSVPAHAEDLTQCKKAQGLVATNPAGARDAYKACLAKGKLSPANTIATHLNLANVNAALGKWADVAAAYDAADAAAKSAGKPIAHSAAANYMRGVALASTGKAARARTYLDAAVKAEPKRYDFVMTRMNVLASLKQNDAAIADAATLIATGQKPLALQGHVLRSALFHQGGRFKEALTEADKAIALDANNPAAHNNRCMTAADLGRRDAVASCEKAIALAPKVPSFWNSLGYAYEKAGKLKEAEVQYAKVATAQPKNANNNAALERVRAALAKPS